MPLILEGIVNTLNRDGSVNISPMGPQVEPDMRSLVLRPYTSSTTYRNLERTGEGVFHVTDDVELLARAAVDRLDQRPELMVVEGVSCPALADACRWYAFRIRSAGEPAPRATFVADVVSSGRVRDFFGLNRAKHAVVEGAILATRVGMLPPADIRSQMANLALWVTKTGGPAEQRAWDFLTQHIAQVLGEG